MALVLVSYISFNSWLTLHKSMPHRKETKRISFRRKAYATQRGKHLTMSQINLPKTLRLPTAPLAIKPGSGTSVNITQFWGGFLICSQNVTTHWSWLFGPRTTASSKVAMSSHQVRFPGSQAASLGGAVPANRVGAFHPCKEARSQPMEVVTNFSFP